MRRRPEIRRPIGSRRWLDRELSSLRRSPARPSAWARFIARSCARSLEQWRLHPGATRDVVVIHLGLAVLTRKPWTGASFILCATHLGLLGDADRLAPADLVSLLRANLPALMPASRWTAPVAALSDAVDGRLARRAGGGTAFGAYLDLLADVAFWSWFAIRSEPKMPIKLFALGFWSLPAVVITAAYFVTGGTVDYPRMKVVREVSGAVQGVLAVRGFLLETAGRRR